MEQVLVGILGDDPYVDYILNQVEMVCNRGLKAAQGQGGASQFVPEAPGATISNLNYTHEARTAEELRASQLTGEAEAAVPVSAPAQPRVIDTGAPRRGTPERRGASKVPWV